MKKSPAGFRRRGNMVEDEMTVIRTVRVHGDLVEISVHKNSKTVYIASGEYLGKHYQTQGRTESNAASNWAEMARYDTN